MKTIKLHKQNGLQYGLPLFLLIVMVCTQVMQAQDVRWFRIGTLHGYSSSRGTEVEGEGYGVNTNFFSWPADYGLSQTAVRQKAYWIGCKNFYDTVLGKTLSYKVVGVGPREAEERPNMIFEQGIRMIAKYPHPNVFVDDQLASHLDIYEEIDEYDENLPCDRMIIIKVNTSIGVTMTKKVLAFSQPYHDDYFIYDITYKNTGIINSAGDVYEQTLEDAYFYFCYRYAFAGESSGGQDEGWGAFESVWGANTLNHDFGGNPLATDFTDPGSPYHQLRGFYSYYGPAQARPVSFEEDWGCPNQNKDGTMSGARFAGCATIHADTDVDDRSDNIYQPRTSWYVSSDEGVWSAGVSQYDEVYMKRRYDFMSEGHPELSHAELIEANYLYAQEFQEVDHDRNAGGGSSQGQGYGPYTLEPGDSIRIVFVEGLNGLSREKNREVGGNWLQYYTGTGTPELVMPDGSTTTDANAYKKAWVFTGVDSILQMYRNAIYNFQSDYDIPQPPPPPDEFIVKSGGDRITLSWSDNAVSHPNFNGYVLYRSEGNVLNPNSVYQKIFECDASDVVHTFDDITASRGFDYYYYIQSKDDGSTEAGKVLKSGMFWTITNVPAYLRRPAGSFLCEVRVVPNPYDIRARSLQFGDEFQYDRIAFYGLPPVCDVKVFTERGDMIWEKYHDDGSGDELWESVTSSGQIIVSGIYILYVEATEDVFATQDMYATHDIVADNGEIMFRKDELMYREGEQIFSKGESIYRKFVVIR